MWIQKISYKQLLIDVLCSNIESDKINEQTENEQLEKFYEKLDKSLCYFFVFVHPNNKNIMKYDSHNIISKNRKGLVHFMTRENGKLSEIELNNDNELYKYNNGIIKKSLKYENMNENKLLDVIKSMNNVNKASYGISHEGIVIRQYVNNSCKVYKIQTEKYKRVKEIKPNNSNEQQSYLELFKKNNLTEYLDLCTKKTFINKAKIIKRLSNLFVVLSREILLLYFKTRKDKESKQFKGSNIYKKLPKSYTDLLFKLHGIYRLKCKESNEKEKVRVRKNDVYKLLKDEMTTKELCTLLSDRINLKKDNLEIFDEDDNSINLTTSLICNL
jgi:hypothetical protein